MKLSNKKPCKTCQEPEPVPQPVICPPPDCGGEKCEETYDGDCVIIRQAFYCNGVKVVEENSRIAPVIQKLFERYCEFSERSAVRVRSNTCFQVTGDGTASNPITVAPILKPGSSNLLKCTTLGLEVELNRDVVAKVLDIIQSDDDLKKTLKAIIEPWFPEIPDIPTPEPEPEPVICPVASDLVVSNLTNKTATLSWKAPSTAIGYRVRYRKTTDLAWLSSDVTATSYELAGLTPNVAYEWQVQTKCLNNLVSTDAPSTFVTQPDPSIICANPSGLSSSNLTTTTARVSWNPIIGAVGYEVRYRKTGDLAWITQTVNTTGVNLSSLSEGVTYQWAVRTICLLNISSNWVDSNFTTKTSPPTCAPVTNIKATEISQTSAVLTWSGPSAASFKVNYRPSGTATWSEVLVSTPTRVLTGLTAKREYEVQITSMCTNGVNATSVDFKFTTLDVPVVPLCDPISITSIQVTDDVIPLCDAIVGFTATPSDEPIIEACALVTGLTVSEYTGDLSSQPLTIQVQDISSSDPNKKRVTITNPSTTGSLIYNWSVYDGLFEAGGQMMTADFQIPSTGTFEIDTSKGPRYLQAGKTYYLYVAEQPGNQRQNYVLFTQASSTNTNPEQPPVTSTGKLVASAFPTSH